MKVFMTVYTCSLKEWISEEFFNGLELVQTVNYAVAETVVHIVLYANNQCLSQ